MQRQAQKKERIDWWHDMLPRACIRWVQGVARCCRVLSLLQCGAGCCRVLQDVTACCKVLQGVAVCFGEIFPRLHIHVVYIPGIPVFFFVCYASFICDMTQS